MSKMDNVLNKLVEKNFIVLETVVSRKQQLDIIVLHRPE